MIRNAQWILVLLGLAVLVRSGTALRCWECSSSTNVMCRDPMNITDHHAMFHIRDCPPSPYQNPKPVCRKVVKREFGELVVVRSCSIPSVDEVDTVDGICSPSMNAGRSTIESCHICSKDLCNSATGASSMQALLAATIGLVAYRLFASNSNDL